MTIYGTTLADTLGYTLMIPLLPLVAKEYGAPDTILGSLLSIPAICSMIAAPAWGMISDRIGRKTVIITAQFLSLAGYLLLALSHSLVLVFVSRIISGLGGGSLGSVEAFIADVTPAEERDSAYALYGAVFGMGFIVGPVASGALLGYGIGFPFLVAAALEVANIIFTLRFLPLLRASTQKRSVRASLRAVSAPIVRQLLTCHFLFMLATVCFLANVGLYLERMLHTGAAASGWYLAGAGAVGGLSLLLLATQFSRRLGDFRISQAGLALTFAAYVLLFGVQNVALFNVVLILWAVGSAFTMPSLTALLSEVADRAERGAVMGASDSIYSVAMVLGPSIGSAIIAANPRFLGSLPALAVIAALWVLSRSRLPGESSRLPA